MKIASFEYEGRASFGVVEGDKIRDCGRTDKGWACLADVLRRGELKRLGEVAASAPEIALDDIRFLPVIPDPSKLFCAGANYSDHLKEAGSLAPPVGKNPLIFLRFADTQMGHGAPILRPPKSTQLDFEGELAVIIGREGRRIPAEQALDYVAGYTVFNDASLRDYQLETTQFTAGKNFPATGACGPWMVTADEIPDPAKLKIRTHLNGQLMQESDTSFLIFDIPRIIAYISKWTTLRPGDVISTGSPAGVGMFRKPPVWMKAGDVVEVEIGGIGVLRNPVIDE